VKRFLETRGLTLAVLAYSAWQAQGLWTAWRHSPYDRLGWLSFVLWLLPALWLLTRRPVLPTSERAPLALTALALALALSGEVLDLNALAYAALAVAWAALMPVTAGLLVWIVGAVSWMPALGWLAHTGLVPSVVSALRLALAAASVVLWLVLSRRSPPA
jgi:hypothetical protein